MKNILKTAGAAVCAAALMCSVGCTGNTKWSFKTQNHELTNGQWIYYTFDGLNSAIEKLHEADENASMENIDWNTQKIDETDAKDWIYAEAKSKAKRYLMLEELADKYGAEVDNGVYVMAKSQYSYFYQNFYKNIFEQLGISEDSYCKAAAMPDLLADEIFTKIYGKGGEKEVSDADTKTFFIDNYAAFYYVSCDLKTTDDTGASTDISADQLETYRANFRKYALMLNDQSKTPEDVTAQYLIDFDTTTAPTTDDAKHKDDMGDTELDKAILECTEGKAVTKEMDDKLYLIYRYDIKTKAESIKGADDETNEETGFIAKEDIVKKMKSDEFNDFLDEQQGKLEYERNDACIHKYDVSRLIDIINKQ